MFPDDVTNQEPQQPKKRGIKTKAELYAADENTLTTDEIERKAAFRRSDKEEADDQDIRERLADRQAKRSMRFDGFKSKGRELDKMKRDHKQMQDRCSHRKGGRGLESLQNGGTGQDFAVIRHLLPTNEIWQRCQRCGKTWRPPNQLDYDMTTESGKAAFDLDLRVYRDALSWPTDNIMSTGITFQHHSENDNDAAAKQFVHDVMRDTTLR